MKENLSNRKGLDITTPENNCRELVVTEVLFSVTVHTTGISIFFQKMSNIKQDFFVNT